MGQKNSSSYSADTISQYKIARVRKDNFKTGKLLDIYYIPNERIFTVAADERNGEKSVDEPICK